MNHGWREWMGRDQQGWDISAKKKLCYSGVNHLHVTFFKKVTYKPYDLSCRRFNRRIIAPPAGLLYYSL
jgi:hypothetical protein